MPFYEKMKGYETKRTDFGMSREYAEERIKEALKLSKGNPTKARQRVIGWTFEDPKLLQALARPHLTGIVAHAVNRVEMKQDLQEPEVSQDPKKLDMSPATFGQEILSALQNNSTPMFGMESSAAPMKRPQASQKHIDALKHIANKGKSDKSE